ncbi:biotin transporter BioY [Paracoccus xiamenensis]|uniref:biotin transporter BioY n=1 Tax=Paracoccus xiamenensis TaxID=2714901 RepID=UPI00140B6E1B|nr:biotin transporter BioY [Paracoccus xiamenensis]NHF72660.1 biotin transporter BioY [Paracoccus xiamenensis]
MTLTQAAFPNRSILMNTMLVLAGSALLAASAQVSVPMFPVPMTLQTLVVSMIGLAYGSRLGAATVLAYLAEGAMGLPVFANFSAGMGPLTGPTAGFLWGFVGMAWLTGFMVERGLDRGFGKLFVAALIPALLLFVPGVLALKAVTGMAWQAAAMVGMVPFLLGALVKAVLAAMAIKGGWTALEQR